MPLIRTIQINDATKVGIWKITEPESYFLSTVSAQKEIKHPQKRRQHLAGRKLLKTLVPGFPLEQIEVAACGKPIVTDGRPHFSISHSGEYAVAIVSERKPVGIDVEEKMPKIKRLASRFLNEQEYRSLPEDVSCYTLSWSAKEAVYKWYGDNKTNIRKHILVQPFQPRDEGKLQVILSYHQHSREITLSYQQQERFVLVWLEEETKIL